MAYGSKFGIQNLGTKKESILAGEKRKMKIECPHCRHLINFYAFEHVDKKLCSYCNIYVFKDRETEFKYRLKEKMKNVV